MAHDAKLERERQGGQTVATSAATATAAATAGTGTDSAAQDAQTVATTREGFRSLWRAVKYMFSHYRWSCAIVFICIIISAFVTAYASLFQQSLIDDYVTPALEGTGSLDGLARTLRQLAGVFAIGVVTNFAYNRIMVNVSQGTLRDLRNDLFTHMESLPISYFDTHKHGDIMSVYTNDVDTLRMVYSQAIPQLVNSLVSIIFTLVFMFMLSVPLTLLSILTVVVMLIASAKITEVSGRYFVVMQDSLAKTNAYTEEMTNGQKVIKVFCHEGQALEGFKRINDQLRDSSIKGITTSTIVMPICANLGNLSYVLCAFVGALMALSGNWGLSLGTLVSFLSLNRGFTQPITQISQLFSNVAMAAAGAGRVFDLLDEEPETDEGYVSIVNTHVDAPTGKLAETRDRTGTWAWKHPHHDGTLTYTKVEGGIELNHVDFSYVEGKEVLHDITFYATPGQKIAFVGATGAGKTTITNLVNRFYDIDDGKIRIDGININKIQKGQLRHSLGMVLQDPHLFTGTVMDNIRYGRLEATDDECIQAAKLVYADGFIRRLPDGYQTMIQGDGENLSQGQRQLLTIARAAVADPPLLILDEATSSIDTRTEQLVQKGMDALMAGRTTLVIAHRLSTVRDANCIMVMDHGRIIERGNHDELIAKKGKYYQLYTGNQIEAAE